jgi:hypothetical protein
MKRLIIASLVLTFVVAFSIGNAQASPLGPYYLQLNEFSDCYTFYLDSADVSAYGNINVYPAIFGGMLWYFSDLYWEIGVGWNLGGTSYLTVFWNNGDECLYIIDGGPNRTLLSCATWSAASGCAVSDGGNTQLGE